MNIMLTKNAVRYCCLLLLETKKTITTLEIKETLRSINFHALQVDVAEMMADLAHELPLNFTNSKGYREYSLPNPNDVIAASANTATPVTDAKNIPVDIAPISTDNTSTISSYLGNSLSSNKDVLTMFSNSATKIGKLVADSAAKSDLAKLAAKAAAETIKATKSALDYSDDKKQPDPVVTFSNLNGNTNANIQIGIPLAFSPNYKPTWSIRPFSYTNGKGNKISGHWLSPLVTIKNRIDGLADDCWVVSESSGMHNKLIFPGIYSRDDVRSAYCKAVGNVDFVNTRAITFKRFDPISKITAE